MMKLATALIVLTTVGLAAPAGASPPAGGCSSDGLGIKCGGTDPAPTTPTTPAPGGGGGDSTPTSPTITTYTEMVPSTPCAIDYTKYRVEVRWRADGSLISSTVRCVADGDPPPDPPPPPPPPPSRDEIVADSAPFLELDTGLSPPSDGFGGVSQLETWLWCENDGDVTVDVTLNGWRAVAVARIQTLVWVIEGPDGRIERPATQCGSEPSPDSDGSSAAAFWTPNEPGDYTITLIATWGGTWTRSFGTISETFDLGSVVVSSPAVDYSVGEIQTVGVGTP